MGSRHHSWEYSEQDSFGYQKRLAYSSVRGLADPTPGMEAEVAVECLEREVELTLRVTPGVADHIACNSGQTIEVRVATKDESYVVPWKCSHTTTRRSSYRLGEVISQRATPNASANAARVLLSFAANDEVKLTLGSQELKWTSHTRKNLVKLAERCGLTSTLRKDPSSAIPKQRDRTELFKLDEDLFGEE